MMDLLSRLAYRNVFRNCRRNALTSLVIAMGVGCLILADGLIMGTNRSMIRGATRPFFGQAQIHHPDFRAEQTVEYTIKNLDTVNNLLTRSAALEAHAHRVVASGMVSSSQNVSAATIYGINPHEETQVSLLKEAIIIGEYFTDGQEIPILIGSKLADLLEVDLHDRLVITATQAATGELIQTLFRVSGIFQFGATSMDQGLVFIPLTKAQQMLGLPGQVHEIALRFRNPGDATNPQLPLWQGLTATGNEALGWDRLLPGVQATIEWSDYSMLIVGGILFAIIAISLINSIFMSIYERMFEFGVIKAIGTRPWQLITMVMKETFLLTVFGGVAGCAIGGAFNIWLSIQGIDYSGLEFAGVAFQEPLRTVVTWQQFIKWPVVVSLMSVVASLYPAVHAARIQVAEAIRKSL